ncbi:MAG: CsgG/HfaB family protein [Synergistaceae bacterium]|jgi:curli biogenesis system outer membrane secretion channel CsgG|nr:CsgG/HfaB family protein [Synergistaceae bacterium]
MKLFKKRLFTLGVLASFFYLFHAEVYAADFGTERTGMITVGIIPFDSSSVLISGDKSGAENKKGKKGEKEEKEREEEKKESVRNERILRWGDLAKDAFTQSLAQTAKTIAVLRRDTIDEILFDMDIANPALAPVPVVAEIGKRAGVQYMITGKVESFRQKVASGPTDDAGNRTVTTTSTAMLKIEFIDVENAKVAIRLQVQGQAYKTKKGDSGVGGFLFGGSLLGDLIASGSTHKYKDDSADEAAIEDAGFNLALKVRREIGGEYSYVRDIKDKKNIEVTTDSSGIYNDTLFLVYADGADLHDSDGTYLGRDKIPFAVLKARQVRRGYSVCEVASQGGDFNLLRKGDKIEPISSAESSTLAKNKKFAKERPKAVKGDVSDLFFDNVETLLEFAVSPMIPLPREEDKVRLGVVNLIPENKSAPGDADLFAEFLVNNLSNSKHVAAFDHKRLLEAIAPERREEYEGDIDRSKAIELGKISDLHYVLLGSIDAKSQPGVSAISVNIEIVNVQTGETVFEATEKGNRNVRSAEFAIILLPFPVPVPVGYSIGDSRTIFAESAWEPAFFVAYAISAKLAQDYAYIVDQRDGNWLIDIGESQGAREGMLFLVYAGENIAGVKNSAQLIEEGKWNIAVLKVASLENNFSVCSIVPNGGNKNLIRRGDRVIPISTAQAKQLAGKKKFVASRPKEQSNVLASFVSESGNAPQSLLSSSIIEAGDKNKSEPLPQTLSSPAPASAKSSRPLENSSTDPGKVIATYGLSSGEANTRRIAHLNARKLSGQKAYDMYAELANSFNGDYLAAYQAGEAARKLKKNDDAKTWYDKALVINPEYKPAQGAREKMK